MSEDTVQAWEADVRAWKWETTAEILELIQRRKALFEAKGVPSDEAGAKAFKHFGEVQRASLKKTLPRNPS